MAIRCKYANTLQIRENVMIPNQSIISMCYSYLKMKTMYLPLHSFTDMFTYGLKNFVTEWNFIEAESRYFGNISFSLSDMIPPGPSTGAFKLSSFTYDLLSLAGVCNTSWCLTSSKTPHISCPSPDTSQRPTATWTLALVTLDQVSTDFSTHFQ